MLTDQNTEDKNTINVIYFDLNTSAICSSLTKVTELKRQRKRDKYIKINR